MLLSAIVRTVDFCIRHVWGVIILALFLAATSGAYAVHHFAIDTNVNDLISRDLPWRQRELDYQAAFPQSTQLILVVVDAPTPEEASAATRALASSLSTTPNVFRSVQEEGGGSFFNQNRFLFLPTEQVERSTRALAGAAPIIRVLVKDPSLRGLVQALSYGLEGVKVGQITLDELAKGFAAASETLENNAAAQPDSFSWDALLQGNAQPSGKRRLIAVVPVLTAGKLEPGLKATDAIRRSAADLHLASKFRANIRLTGPVPISDEEFASIQKGLSLNSIVTGFIVLIILWAALRYFGLFLRWSSP